MSIADTITSSVNIVSLLHPLQLLLIVDILNQYVAEKVIDIS